MLVFSALAIWFAFDLLHSLSDCEAVEGTAAISTLFSSKHQLKIFDKNLHTVFCKIGAPLLFNCNLLYSDVEFSKFSSGQLNISFHAKFRQIIISFAFSLKRSARVMMLETVASRVFDFSHKKQCQCPLLISLLNLAVDQKWDHLCPSEARCDRVFLLMIVLCGLSYI